MSVSPYWSKAVRATLNEVPVVAADAGVTVKLLRVAAEDYGIAHRTGRDPVVVDGDYLVLVGGARHEARVGAAGRCRTEQRIRRRFAGGAGRGASPAKR